MLRWKYPKGTYGSLDFRKKTGLLKILLGLFGVLAILFLGIYMTGSKQNILTVVAVVSVLPVGNVAATWLAMLPHKTGPREHYESLSKVCGSLVMTYDLVITSKEAIMPVEAAAIHESEILLYLPSKKVDLKKTEEYVISIIRGNELNTKIRGVDDFSLFLKEVARLAGLETKGRDSDDLLKKEGVLIAISM